MLALRDLMRPIGDNNTLQPVCPICSRALRLKQAAATDQAAAVRTFGCVGCGIWLTEAEDAVGSAPVTERVAKR